MMFRRHKSRSMSSEPTQNPRRDLGKLPKLSDLDAYYHPLLDEDICPPWIDASRFDAAREEARILVQWLTVPPKDSVGFLAYCLPMCVIPQVSRDEILARSMDLFVIVDGLFMFIFVALFDISGTKDSSSKVGGGATWEMSLSLADVVQLACGLSMYLFMGHIFATLLAGLFCSVDTCGLLIDMRRAGIVGHLFFFFFAIHTYCSVVMGFVIFLVLPLWSFVIMCILITCWSRVLLSFMNRQYGSFFRLARYHARDTWLLRFIRLEHMVLRIKFPVADLEALARHQAAEFLAMGMQNVPDIFGKLIFVPRNSVQVGNSWNRSSSSVECHVLPESASLSTRDVVSCTASQIFERSLSDFLVSQEKEDSGDKGDIV
eukprot:GEMP01066184.1.p1 GENE.GEMP01066184.1~~GEMP01066184.1.p1  ORF type:complete len:374 (-),score=58.00 GEMP01066184.1:4-1125(-)